ncbi:hypothetical protein [Desulfocicer vacuolatum]|nr:hypothetical protein [Desulfocicer vacuolatum]
MSRRMQIPRELKWAILYEILHKPGGISNFVVGGAGSEYGLPVAVI